MRNKRCIVNAYAGPGWYAEGQARLYKSWPDDGKTDVLLLNPDNIDSDIINEYYFPECPYTIKAAAIAMALKNRYEQILWLDCSVQLIKPIHEMWSLIEREGFFFMVGGWNCAQSCNDRSLDYFGYTRDQAELLPELWSCIFGFDMSNPQAKEVCYLWLQSAKDKIFHGSRHHDNQSADPRFLHHRQDQSALSLAYHKTGLQSPYPPNKYMAYVGMGDPITNDTLFTVQGL